MFHEWKWWDPIIDAVKLSLCLNVGAAHIKDLL